MDSFDKNFADLDVVDDYMREATSSATAVGTPQSDVDQLMNKTADKIGVELHEDLEEATPTNTKIVTLAQDTNALDERLKALRN
jgi:charged multivesicular body protein 1